MSSTGNRGLPIVLQGPLTPTILNSIKSTSFMELKPSARSTYPSYDSSWVFHESSQTTLRFEGSTYALQYVQLFSPINSTYYGGGGATPIAEFALFYKPLATTHAQHKLLVTFVPVFGSSNSSSSNTGQYLTAALTRDTSYKGSVAKLYSDKSIHYDTTVLTVADDEDNDDDNITTPIKIDVLVFTSGISLDQSTTKLLTTAIASTPLKAFGFPAQLLPSLSHYTVSVPTSPPTLDKSTNPLRIVYTTLVSTGSDIFTGRFRYYANTFIQSAAEKAKDATAYKCVAIDPSKDLKKVGEKYVVQLGNGDLADTQSLQDVASAGSKDSNSNSSNKDNSSSDSSTGTYVAIAIGGTVGITLAAITLWGAFRLLLRNNN